MCNWSMKRLLVGKRRQLVSLVVTEESTDKGLSTKITEYHWKVTDSVCVKLAPYITIIVLAITLGRMFKGCNSDAEKPIQGIINAEVKASTSVQVVSMVNNGKKD